MRTNSKDTHVRRRDVCVCCLNLAQNNGEKNRGGFHDDVGGNFKCVSWQTKRNGRLIIRKCKSRIGNGGGEKKIQRAGEPAGEPGCDGE